MAKKKRKRPSDGLRAALIRHFKLHEYASNAAIAFCIQKETGAPLPGSAADMHKYLNDYWQSRNRRSRPPAPKRPRSGADFYQSRKWIELRYIALSMVDGRCCLCGASAKDGAVLHVDHIKPRSLHPALQYDLDNLQVLCADCNIGKSNYDDRDWRLLM